MMGDSQIWNRAVVPSGMGRVIGGPCPAAGVNSFGVPRNVAFNASRFSRASLNLRIQGPLFGTSVWRGSIVSQTAPRAENPVRLSRRISRPPSSMSEQIGTAEKALQIESSFESAARRAELLRNVI